MTGIVLGFALLTGAWLGWPGLLLITISTAFAGMMGERRLALLAALVIAAGVGATRVGSQDVPPAPPWTDTTTELHGTVLGGAVDNGSVQRFELIAQPVDDPTADAVRLCATGPILPALTRGDLVRLDGSVRSLADVESRTARYLRSRGCSGTVDADDMFIVERGYGLLAWFDDVRRNLTANIQRAAPGDAGALMAGLVTGDDAAVSKDRRDAFIVTGTSHVTAVSGSNLALIAAMIAWFSTRTTGGKARRWQIATLLALWGYVGIIGVTPPPFRAACIASLAICASWAGRRPDFVTLSVLVAATELIVRPDDFHSLAYRLSTVSAIALVLGLAGHAPKGALGWLRHSVIGTTATQAATSPLLIPAFGRLNVFAIPANIVVAPLCGVAFGFAVLAGLVGFISPGLAVLAAAPGAVVCNVVLAYTGWLAELPGAESGSGIAAIVPPWLWIATGLATVILLSQECRGGIVRSWRELRALDRARQGIAGGAAAGVTVGLAIVTFFR